MNFEELGLSVKGFMDLNDEKIASLKRYRELVLESNKQFNLTSITDENEFIIKHFYDSLIPLKYLSIEGKEVLDFGSGAGFPGVPFAISVPNARLTLLDATRKKCLFLSSVKDELRLDNVEVVCARGESLAKKERFDVVTARAVASLPILLELVSQSIRVGGRLLALKGDHGKDELSESEGAIKKLGFKLEKVEEYELPEKMGGRTLIILKKVAKTPNKFPRLYADMLKKPL